jgi:hypothetical protein
VALEFGGNGEVVAGQGIAPGVAVEEFGEKFRAEAVAAAGGPVDV